MQPKKTVITQLLYTLQEISGSCEEFDYSFENRAIKTKLPKSRSRIHQIKDKIESILKIILSIFACGHINYDQSSTSLVISSTYSTNFKNKYFGPEQNYYIFFENRKMIMFSKQGIIPKINLIWILLTQKHDYLYSKALNSLFNINSLKNIQRTKIYMHGTYDPEIYLYSLFIKKSASTEINMGEGILNHSRQGTYNRKTLVLGSNIMQMELKNLIRKNIYHLNDSKVIIRSPKVDRHKTGEVQLAYYSAGWWTRDFNTQLVITPTPHPNKISAESKKVAQTELEIIKELNRIAKDLRTDLKIFLHPMESLAPPQYLDQIYKDYGSKLEKHEITGEATFNKAAVAVTLYQQTSVVTQRAEIGLPTYYLDDKYLIDNLGLTPLQRTFRTDLMIKFSSPTALKKLMDKHLGLL